MLTIVTVFQCCSIIYSDLTLDLLLLQLFLQLQVLWLWLLLLLLLLLSILLLLLILHSLLPPAFLPHVSRLSSLTLTWSSARIGHTGVLGSRGHMLKPYKLSFNRPEGKLQLAPDLPTLAGM